MQLIKQIEATQVNVQPHACVCRGLEVIFTATGRMGSQRLSVRLGPTVGIQSLWQVSNGTIHQWGHDPLVCKHTVHRWATTLLVSLTMSACLVMPAYGCFCWEAGGRPFYCGGAGGESGDFHTQP